MTKQNNQIPTNPYKDKYSSLIRPIRIFLPVRGGKGEDANESYDDFVGRERLMEKLFNWLADKKKENGSYLITGFRGMGKTILVERVVNRLTREVNERREPWWLLLSLVPVIVAGVLVAIKPFNLNYDLCLWIASGFVVAWSVAVILIHRLDKKYYSRKKKQAIEEYPNHELFDDGNVDKMVRGRKDDYEQRSYHFIRISVNLGHEVLRERDVLSMIATSVKEKYESFVKSVKPHLLQRSVLALVLSFACFVLFDSIQKNYSIESDSSRPAAMNTEVNLSTDAASVSIQGDNSNTQRLVVSERSDNSNNQQVIVNGKTDDSWVARFFNKTKNGFIALFNSGTGLGALFRFIVFVLAYVFLRWAFWKLFQMIPFCSRPIRALRRLEMLTERLNTVTGEETGMAPSANSSVFTISLFSRRKQKTRPIADIREIETELAEIINMIHSDNKNGNYSANFIVVFDEMDKIDPAMMEQHKTTELPEFTDSVKGFPDGMDSRERRRNVLKLLANIKLFVSTAKAKFIFISGRELYDAYLADLSDRDFAISSIFSGVINVDSFLTPEGGQTDVRSMSEWYIINRMIPWDWLEKVERKNADGIHGKEKKAEKKKDWAVLKPEKPSLRWYYEYLTEVIRKSEANEVEKQKKYTDAMYVIGFLHTFAAYLTHISNGSPKKIFLYFDKYLRYAKDCVSMNDWNDVCSVGQDLGVKEQKVLYFEPIHQRTINFVYYLSNPIMGAVTNDMSNYGDRFLVSLSFIIDHIYKYHNRSFSWRNLEQIPDLLKTSKAPELRDEMTSIMEYLSQIHISPILIGLNEYKFHKSIAEEISVMSRMSDEASAIFNFTLDESLSVIQYNTRLLNYYIELDKEVDKNNSGKHKHRYLPLIARIHSNLGDLHFWDEDYYSATLEYRAAIETLPVTKEDESGFLTRVRCMLKLGLAYESRKLYPNAYQTYCRLINLLINNRWVHEDVYGLKVMAARIKGWPEKRQMMYYSGHQQSKNDTFRKQFGYPLFEGDYNEAPDTSYSVNFDGIISSFAGDLTIDKSQTINTLTLFEEIRYLYQAILAKLSILEKMGMSGITQTNIAVAEGEFRTIHKSVNIREKFIISADFFRKLAEILYYKNNLTLITQNQNSFYASVYYDDHDLLANLDDFCLYNGHAAIQIKHDIKRFFYKLNNSASKDTEFRFNYSDQLGEGKKCSVKKLYDNLKSYIDKYIITEKIDNQGEKNRIQRNLEAFFNYNIDVVHTNEDDLFYFGGVEACEHHCKLLREKGFRTPCYSCKYYTRSLRILAKNMFEDKDVLEGNITKAISILKNSFKNKLLYTNSTIIRALAQTLEGFGNVMYACASGNDCEGEEQRSPYGINPNVIKLLKALSLERSETEEIEEITNYENILYDELPLSRLDKSILYYWDAYRFYLMDGCHNEAVGCLNKVLNILVYYTEVFCYYGNNAKLHWEKDEETIIELIGDNEFNDSFLAILFQLIARYTSYKYDLTNLNEINELKWIFSKEIREDIDLTRLSLYPAIRSAWLRVVEIKAKGLGVFAKKEGSDETQKKAYTDFIAKVYPLIAPKRRYETTFYEEVMGYYTKMRFNDHILNNLMGGNPIVAKDKNGYSPQYHYAFYKKLGDYLESDHDKNRLDCSLFEIEKKDVGKRLELIEYLIHDTLVCLTNMVNVFTPHNHLTSYSKSFVGIVYNFFWEWSRKYELLYSLYQFQELLESKPGKNDEAKQIIHNIWRSGSIQTDDENENEESDGKNKEKEKQGLFIQFYREIFRCRELIKELPKDGNNKTRYGNRSDRLYEKLRHDIDDITINTIYSNYTAEMALKYYQMAKEANTEGEAYKEMMGTLHYLNDDLNNDTCQFNIACDRFLLNCSVVDEQRCRLEKLYKNSNVYSLNKAYIVGPNKQRERTVGFHQFDRSQFINSEY